MPDIASMLDDLLNAPKLPLDDAVERHVTEGYRQRTDGEWASRAEFVAHMSHLRDIVAEARVEVLDEFVTPTGYADRHRVHLTKRDGVTVIQEVYLFGELAQDGRFSRIEEVTLMLAGTDADRGIGSAR